VVATETIYSSYTGLTGKDQGCILVAQKLWTLWVPGGDNSIVPIPTDPYYAGLTIELER
jgi:hypothetical protein